MILVCIHRRDLNHDYVRGQFGSIPGFQASGLAFWVGVRVGLGAGLEATGFEVPRMAQYTPA